MTPTGLSFISAYGENKSLRIYTGQRAKCIIVLKQAQELYCLTELVVSSNPRSEAQTAKEPFFLKSHLKGDFLDTLKRLPS